MSEHYKTIEAMEGLMRDLGRHLGGEGIQLTPNTVYDRLHEALYHDQWDETEKPSALFNCQGYGLKNHSMDSRPEKPNEGQG